MMNVREQYYRKANNMMERLFGEAPEDEVPTEDTPPAEGEIENPEGTPEDNAAEEKGQAQQVEIYFSNLNEETQKVLMDALKESLNASEDDKTAEDKIAEVLKNNPLIILRADEIVRKLKIEI